MNIALTIVLAIIAAGYIASLLLSFRRSLRFLNRVAVGAAAANTLIEFVGFHSLPWGLVWLLITSSAISTAFSQATTDRIRRWTR